MTLVAWFKALRKYDPGPWQRIAFMLPLGFLRRRVKLYTIKYQKLLTMDKSKIDGWKEWWNAGRKGE